MNRLLLVASIITVLFGGVKAQAVELLISPDFELPVGLPEINDWTLQEFVTAGCCGTGNPITDTAGSATNAQAGDGSVILKAWVGNGVLDPNDGNFDNDDPNNGGWDVDGYDFLLWQRGGSPTPNSQTDLTTWENNYGRVSGQLANAILSQTVPGTPDQEYTFSGWALWEDNYSGGPAGGTLDPGSPLGAVATPTTNTLKMEFLDSGGGVLGTHSVNLADDDGKINDAFTWTQHSVTGTAPAGTANIRVSADGRDMVYNVDPLQAAFYDTFSLIDTADPNETELLANAGLDEPFPSPLDFWDLLEVPDPNECCNGEILRTPAAPYANHTPGGTRGVWLSAFFGGASGIVGTWPEDPVTGLMSQTVEADPNVAYSFSGWVKFEQSYSGGVDTIANAGGDFAGQPSPTETIIALEFLDPNGVVISSIIDFDPNGVSILDPNSPNFIDLRTERELTCGGNANDPNCGDVGSNGQKGWTQHTLSNIIAPPGTAFARLTAGMIDGVFNENPGQSAFFDDFSLVSVPIPLQGDIAVVPEPATSVGLIFGAMMFGIRRRRRRAVCEFVMSPEMVD